MYGSNRDIDVKCSLVVEEHCPPSLCVSLVHWEERYGIINQCGGKERALKSHIIKIGIKSREGKKKRGKERKHERIDVF